MSPQSGGDVAEGVDSDGHGSPEGTDEHTGQAWAGDLGNGAGALQGPVCGRKVILGHQRGEVADIWVETLVCMGWLHG